MGVRREGSGKSRAAANAQALGVGCEHVAPEAASSSSAPVSAVSAAARVNGSSTDVGGDASDDENDPELQEVYVQAYACQIFADDAAAQAVEDGAHLRPLASPQEPEGQPLMLDRFDARWMLDMSDLSKESSRFTGAASVVCPEDEEADVLRYAGLPPGDHSVEVEGLGRFAPEGSYAHDRRRGLGDQDVDGPNEVYGYYGRTAQPPPEASRPPWAAIPGPQYPSEEKSGGGVGGEGGSGVEGADGETPKVGGDEEVFVPDFVVPEGFAALPSTPRQHMMMVGTARTAVRSPQLEVLLRLKQAGNAAFSFLSDGDPLHGYYLFLKSWGEDALASEYARQQRLQAERAAERERRKEEEEVGAEEGSEAEAKPKAGTKSSPDVEKATIAKAGAAAPATESSEDDEVPDAPNLLGGAYDSSDDEEEDDPKPESAGLSVKAAKGEAGGRSLKAGTVIAAAGTLERAKGGVADAAGVSADPPLDASQAVLEPDKAKRLVVEKMVGFVARNGQAFEDKVRERAKKSDPTFDFVLPSNRYYPYYKARLAKVREEQSVDGMSGAVGQANDVLSAQAKGAVSMTKANAGGTAAGAPSSSRLAVKGNDSADGSGDSERQARAEEFISVGSGKSMSAAELEEEAGMGGGEEQNGSIKTAGRSNSESRRGGSSGMEVEEASATEDLGMSPDDGAKRESGREGKHPRVEAAQGVVSLPLAVSMAKAAGSDGALSELKSADCEHDGGGEPGAASSSGWVKGLAEAGEASYGNGDHEPLLEMMNIEGDAEDDGGGESEETRRANRLKRARLMKGHYKLAVLRSSGGRDAAAATDPPGQASPADEGSAGVGVVGAEDDGSASPNGNKSPDISDHDLSDLDSDDDGHDAPEADEDNTTSDGDGGKGGQPPEKDRVRGRPNDTGAATDERQDPPAPSSQSTSTSTSAGSKHRRGEERDSKEKESKKRRRSRSRSRSRSKKVERSERRDSRKDDRSTRHRQERSGDRRSRSRSRSNGRPQGDRERLQQKNRDRPPSSPGRSRGSKDDGGRHRSSGGRDAGSGRRGGDISRDDEREKSRARSTGEDGRSRSSKKIDSHARRDSRDREENKRDLLPKSARSDVKSSSRKLLDEKDKRRDRDGRSAGGSVVKDAMGDWRDSREQGSWEKSTREKNPRERSSRDHVSWEHSSRESHSSRKEASRQQSFSSRRSRSNSAGRVRDYRGESRERSGLQRSRRR